MNLLDMYGPTDAEGKPTGKSDAPVASDYHYLVQTATSLGFSEKWLQEEIVKLGGEIDSGANLSITWDWDIYQKIEDYLAATEAAGATTVQYQRLVEQAERAGLATKAEIDSWHPDTSEVTVERLDEVGAKLVELAEKKGVDLVVAEAQEVSKTKEGHYVDSDGTVITDDDGNPITDEQIITLLGLPLMPQLPQTVQEFQISDEQTCAQWAQAVDSVWCQIENIIDAAAIHIKTRLRWINALEHDYKPQALKYGRDYLEKKNGNKKNKTKKVVFENGAALFFRKGGGTKCEDRDEVEKWIKKNIRKKDYKAWQIEEKLSFDVRNIIKVAQEKGLKVPGTVEQKEDEYATMKVGSAKDRSGWSITRLSKKLEDIGKLEDKSR